MLAFVGAAGECGLVVDGSAQAEPLGAFPPETLVARLGRMARHVDHARRPGERAADTLARLGRDGVAALILEDAGT